MLIVFAEAKIPDAKGQLILSDVAHGRVRFWRKIRFGGRTEAQKGQLIQQLKESGYQPRDEERERSMLFMKQHPEVWSDEEIEKKMSEAGFDTDRKWRAAMEFHSV